MEKEKVSVIIPLYNKEKHIRKTIESVLNQDYDNFEIIVVDDGSSDKSADVVKEIADNRILYYLKENGGVSSARNYGIDKSHSSWLIFLDADDLLYANCISTLIESHKLYPKADIICAGYDILENNKIIFKSHNITLGYVRNGFKDYFYGKFHLRMGSALVNKNIAGKYKFPEYISRYEDEKVFLDYIRNSQIACVNNVVMGYIHNSISLSIGNPNDISKDFQGCMCFKGKGFWEKCILGRLLNAAHNSYNMRFWLYMHYGKYTVYMYISKMLSHLKVLS